MPMRGDEFRRQAAQQPVVFCRFLQANGIPSDFPLRSAPDLRTECSRQQLTAETNAKHRLIGRQRACDERDLFAQVRVLIELIDGLRTTHYDQPTESLHILRNRMTVEDADVLPR